MRVADPLLELLGSCVVRIDRDGKFAGTGFLVAPGEVLTCAHVVHGGRPITVTFDDGTVCWADPVTALLAPEDPAAAFYPQPDAAVLRLTEPPPVHACVRLEASMPAVGEWLQLVGFTIGEHAPGRIWRSGAMLQVETLGFEDGHTLVKLREGQVIGGFSGAPLLNLRTRAVSTLVDSTRSPSSSLGGFGVPIAAVLAELDVGLLERNAVFHDSDDRWARACTEQGDAEAERAGRRELLEAVAPLGAGEHVAPSNLLRPQHAVVPFVRRLGAIDGYINPPEHVCARIRQSLSGTPGVVVFTGHSGYGKTGLAVWASRDPEVQATFRRIVAVEYRDDWPADTRQQRAFEEFSAQIRTSSGETKADELLSSESTLLILDDVRLESDLQPFEEFFDRCTILVTALDSKIATALNVVESRPFTHFDLTSSLESAWVRMWARSILTHGWPLGTAVGDLVQLCGSWPLLVRRVNLAVKHLVRLMPGLVAYNDAIRDVENKLRRWGPDHFDPPGDEDRHKSVRASVELMLQITGHFDQSALSPSNRFKELGALPSDAMVPIEVLDALWKTNGCEAANELINNLHDLGMVQLEHGRVRLLDSDRGYLREKYKTEIQKAHRRLVQRADQSEVHESIVGRYLAEYRIWHLIGAHKYKRLARELSSPEFLVNTALERGVPALEYDLDLALTLPDCSSKLPDAERLLRPLLRQIRQSIDLLAQCRTRESFCPTLASRLQAQPELADLAVSLSRCVPESVIHVEGPPHDVDDSRLVRRLSKRTVAVKALSWMVEPDRVGVAFQDGAARLWEPPQLYRLRESRKPDYRRVTLAAWAEIGGFLAMGRADGSVTVWPLTDSEGPKDLEGQGVAALAWSKKGELAYAGWAGALASWSHRGGTQWPASGIDGTRITAMAWSNNSEQLAVASSDGAVFVNVGDGPVEVLQTHKGGAAFLAWSASGDLACAGWQGSVRVVQPNARVSDLLLDHQSDPRGPAVLAWDEDGDRLAIGGLDGAVAVWSPPRDGQAKTIRTAFSERTRAVRALAWSPTAPCLAAAHDGGVIRFWNDEDAADEVGRPPAPIVGHRTDIVGIAWSGRGDGLAAASSDGAVTIWDPFRPSKYLPSVIRTNGPTTVLFSMDGRAVATAEQAGAIRLWDLWAGDREARRVRTLKSRAAWQPAIGWAPSSPPLWVSRFATGGVDGFVKEWSGEWEADSTVLLRHKAWVSTLAWSRDGQLATLGRDWVIFINQPPRRTFALVAHEGGTTAMAWNPDGSLLATAGNDWLVRIWRRPEVSGGACTADSVSWGLVAQFRAHLGGVTALEWAPGGTELATAGWDRTVRRWRLRRGSTRPTAPTPPTESAGSRPVSWQLMDTWSTRTSAVNALAWSPDGTSLVGGDRRGQLRLWRCQDISWTEMKSSHESLVTGLRWSKGANRILSTGMDGTLRVWGANGAEQARIVFRTPVYSLDVQDGSGLVAVGGEHGATILRLAGKVESGAT